MRKCSVHNIDLECMGGCSAHSDNWYCTECEKETTMLLTSNKDKANETQVAGEHYRTSIQHWDYVIANELNYFEAQIIKYATRCRKKNGIEDLRKARHFLDKYIERYDEINHTFDKEEGGADGAYTNQD